jgi:predicted Zn-dependent protease
LPLLIAIFVILLLFGAKILPRLGHYLGSQSRKPYRQAKWMWTSFAGTEEESIKAEREYGRECAREFIRQFPETVPASDQEIVSGIGARLAEKVDDSRREFRFALVSSSTANAFALPGGFVFMTDALLNLCERDRDEIAFFLGHEIGHIVHGHAKEQLATSTLLNAVTARLSGVGRMIREVLGKGYSRTLEMEADAAAVRLAVAADFDSEASVRALQRLSQVAPDNAGLAEYFSSHPSIAERVKEIEDQKSKI